MSEHERLLAAGKIPEAMVLAQKEDEIALEAWQIIRDAARTRRSDAWGMVSAEAQAFLDAHPSWPRGGRS